MIRLLRFLLQLAVFAALALWLADRPGTAHIVWRDFVIDTSAAFLAVGVVLLAFLLHLVFRFWHFIVHAPENWRLRHTLKKMHQAQDLWVQALDALAAGNAVEAGRLAVAARKNGGNPVVAQWLQAQAARLAGDKRAAQDILRAMAAQEGSVVLGYRGLIDAALDEGNWDEVDRLLTEVRGKKTKAPWLGLIRMQSAARRRDWPEAEAALALALDGRLLNGTAARRARAALRIAAARTATVTGDKEAALAAAENAAKQTPEGLPAAIALAEALVATEHNRAATRLIERMWKKTPHPRLAELYARMAPNALEALKQAERLGHLNETAPESRLAVAEAALAADVWGTARRHLLACVNERVATQNVYKMLARLERRERGDERAATAWLSKATEAPADPRWMCGRCGEAHEIWHPVCAACGSFNTLDWQRAGKDREGKKA